MYAPIRNRKANASNVAKTTRECGRILSATSSGSSCSTRPNAASAICCTSVSIISRSNPLTCATGTDPVSLSTIGTTFSTSSASGAGSFCGISVVKHSSELAKPSPAHVEDTAWIKRCQDLAASMAVYLAHDMLICK
jgi:hypothetical protein